MNLTVIAFKISNSWLLQLNLELMVLTASSDYHQIHLLMVLLISLTWSKVGLLTRRWLVSLLVLINTPQSWHLEAMMKKCLNKEIKKKDMEFIGILLLIHIGGRLKSRIYYMMEVVSFQVKLPKLLLIVELQWFRYQQKILKNSKKP